MTLLTVACQALLSMEFSRQEYWSGWPFPSPGLIALSTVNLQSQGWFVPVSLRPFLRIAAASMSWLQSGHHVINFFHLMGVSVSLTAHRIWLRVLSIAPEEELKVLDFAY